jgi:phosphoglucosamine mutase
VKSDLKGVKVLIDCANGAASDIAPQVFKATGCDLEVVCASPNGLNINADCGSTHMNNLINMVKAGHYDIAFAYDGDADRVLAISDSGDILDGDVLMAVLSLYLKENGLLSKDTVVVTELSNLGMDHFVQKNGLKLVRTKVGDRYVVEEMQKSGYAIGGEQSGHIIMLPFQTTGDGILNSLKLTEILARNKMKSHEFFDIMRPLPQVMINARIRNENKPELKNDEIIQKEYHKIESELINRGRIVLRVSGTEPVIRVMIEGDNVEYINEKARGLADLIHERLG